MKKNYTFVEIKVISLDNADVITASGATKNNSLFGGNFISGGDDLGTQNFN